MRMRWVQEDYEVLWRLLEAGAPERRQQAPLAPGELILRLRRGLQVSQLQLAQKAGISRSLVARLEAGGDVQIASLKRLFQALSCDLVILPCSQPLREFFKARALQKRRAYQQWERISAKAALRRDTAHLTAAGKRY